MKRVLTVREMILCAIFAALTAIFSQIAIPVGPVLFNLATLAVFLTGGVLGARCGTMAQLCYVLLGAVGIPVFAFFTGGVGVLVGPTGGYIIGYLVAALLTGLAVDRFGRKPLALICGMVAGLAACYALGTAWFMVSTGNGLLVSLGYCVLPFLIGDAAKIAVATVLVPRLYLLLQRTVRTA